MSDKTVSVNCFC